MLATRAAGAGGAHLCFLKDIVPVHGSEGL
jgi:hypothetical protein